MAPKKKPDHMAGLSHIAGVLFGDVHPCTQRREYNMKHFAQRDFVNTTPIKVTEASNAPLANVIGKFITLCLSTIGLVYSLMLMWIAHQ